MRWLAPLVGMGLLLASFGPTPARAQAPVVLEFFTSQGCTSCPPADELFAELARVPGIIGLALHVDYWDYLGWKDVFGKAEHTERQRDYAKAHKERTIFTPQMIVQGQELLIGHDEEAIREAIAAHRERPVTVALDVRRDGAVIEIAIAPEGDAVGPADVHVVEFVPEHAMTVDGGENAGYHHAFANIVTRWVTLARWDGRAPVDLRFEGAEQDDVAVIVQAVRYGPILSAAQLP